jgi:hypothetical protein
LRPAAFFWAVVPPCFELDLELPLLDFFPPRLDAPGELAILAARSLDIPFSFSFSYCFSFLTFGRLLGMRTPFWWGGFPLASAENTTVFSEDGADMIRGESSE